MANVITRSRSGFRRVAGVRRRETQWIGDNMSATTITAASTATLINVLSTVDLALRPFTIVRTRGYMHWVSDQSAGTELYGGVYGEAVVSEQASAIGVTAIPTPVTDTDSDLFYTYEPFGGQFVLSDATGIMEAGWFRTFDSKAMRKVEDGQDAITVVESNVAAFGGGGFIFSKLSRFLIKLH